MPQTILVTNINHEWGQRIALRLTRHLGYRVIGIGATIPADRPPYLTCYTRRLTDPTLADFLKQQQVDVICHPIADDDATHIEAVVNQRIQATKNLFLAALKAEVPHIIWQSSTAVYGAHPHNPAFLPETATLYPNTEHTFTQYLNHVETISYNFQQKYPQLTLTTLRFANIIGKSTTTATSRWLQGYTMPALLGFDPLMQFIHEDDIAETFAHAITQKVGGAFNIAATELMPLTQVASLSHTPPLLLWPPFAYRWQANTASEYHLFGWDSLRYRWVGDIAKMESLLRYTPSHTAVSALRDFATHKAIRRLSDEADAITQDEQRLQTQLARWHALKAAQHPVP